MKINKWYIFIFIVSALGFSSNAQSNSDPFVSLPSVDFVFGDTTSLLEYNHVTDMFVGVTENTQLNVAPGPGVVATDFTGSITMSAIIDEAGGFLRGTLVWRGGSQVLGIADDTLLIAADIILFSYFEYTRPQFVANVQFIDPQIELVMGPIKSILWTGVTIDGYCEFGNFTINFTCSWQDGNPPLVTIIDFSTSHYSDFDSDLDARPNFSDNCTDTPNRNQIDADHDDFGNACDADFNQDCIINFLDVAMFADQFLGVNPIFDLNSDGTVNFVDFSMVATRFLQEPGPNFLGICNNPVAEEGFDEGSNGWNFGFAITQQTEGGNSGGYLRFDDPGQAGGAFIFAPAELLGDWSDLDGRGLIRFQHRIFQTSPPFLPLEVTISGSGGEATWYGPEPLGASFFWREFRVPINEADFTVVNGNWDSTLQGVDTLSFKISSSSTNLDHTGFDNFELRR